MSHRQYSLALELAAAARLLLERVNDVDVAGGGASGSIPMIAPLEVLQTLAVDGSVTLNCYDAMFSPECGREPR
jgi:hypothetical protein